ncbi:MAG TPA: hypothetical protein VIP70_12300 [Nitrososphaeraceae archaeon]
MQRGMISFVVLIISVIMAMTNIIYHASSDYSVYAQKAPSSSKAMGVKVISPTQGQKVPTGELNVTGISTDNSTTDCHVYIDVNDIKPLQNTTARGPDGINDYSNWSFTYTEKYHPIVEGTNELTAKLSCINNPGNISKWYSVNVTGVATGSDDKDIASLNNGTQHLVETHNKGDHIKQLEDQSPIELQQQPQSSQAEISASSPEALNKIQKHEEEKNEIIAEEEQEGQGIDEQPLQTFDETQPSSSTSEQQPLETPNEQPLQTFDETQPSSSTSEQQPLEPSIHTQGQEDIGPNKGRQDYQDDSMPFVLPFDSNDVISNK